MVKKRSRRKHRKHKLKTWLVAAGVTAVVGFGAFLPSPRSTADTQTQSQVGVHTTTNTANPSAASQGISVNSKAHLIPVVITKNTDGDTIHVRLPSGQTVTIRMLLIDTPESVDPVKPVEPYGPDASHYAKEVLPVGRHIYIQEGKPGYTKDKYGRLLAYVFITPHDMYNADVVRMGLARVAYVYPPNTDYLSTLEADQQFAKAHHLDIWSIPGYVGPNGYSLSISKRWNATHGYSTGRSSGSSTGSSSMSGS